MNANRPNCTIEEALDLVDSMGSTPAAFVRVAYSTGWESGKLEAAYDRRYRDWAASRGYDL